MSTEAIFWGTVGAAGGAVISVLTALFLRSVEEWRSFQREIAMIRDRFDRMEDRPAKIEDRGIEPIRREYAKSVPDVITAVLKVRPYILKCQRERLSDLLCKFRHADQSGDSGMTSGRINVNLEFESLPDRVKAKAYLMSLLERMERLSDDF